MFPVCRHVFGVTAGIDIRVLSGKARACDALRKVLENLGQSTSIATNRLCSGPLLRNAAILYRSVGSFAETSATTSMNE